MTIAMGWSHLLGLQSSRIRSGSIPTLLASLAMYLRVRPVVGGAFRFGVIGNRNGRSETPYL